ncbi:MAG: hypothetical protein L6R39_000448 [Caloplaca ligustica]|nr:MAG: hypothetical protein L6R39_000448 [Caloplaca ligustica]
MIGAHTDSPVLRVKPVSKKQGEGFIQVGVETYGGGLWHTCMPSTLQHVSKRPSLNQPGFDRDLSLAGRVMVKTEKGDFVQKLVKIDKPILRIPTLAIHLDRQENFTFNKETQLFPIAGLVAAELNRTSGGAPESTTTPGSSSTSTESSASDDFTPLKTSTERHHPYIVELIANSASVPSSSIMDFELILYDTQSACLGGLNDELIFSARLDNLGMSYCAVTSLINSLASPSALDNERCIRLIALFDHEEIGSRTAQGADSNLLPAIIRRLSVVGPSGSEKTETAYEQTLATSFLVSADMAHSVNPNYASKYENDHKPEMNKGTVIKINANARYATNSPGITLIQEVARRHKVPLQLFVVRNDSSCGSTIGPMLAASLGARTLDLGNPQLSMHSIRETGGVYDVHHGIRLFEGFFEHFGELEGKIFVD